jgi:hypothetical protein
MSDSWPVCGDVLETCADFAEVIVCTWLSINIVAIRKFSLAFGLMKVSSEPVVAGRLKRGVETCADDPEFGYQ